MILGKLQSMQPGASRLELRSERKLARKSSRQIRVY